MAADLLEPSRQAMSERRVRVDREELGPQTSYNGRLTIASAHDRLRGEWRVVVALETSGAIPAGGLVSADFDAAEVAAIIAALEAARDEVRSRLT